MLAKRQYKQFTGREQTSDVIAYQVRQSFKPGEVTAEEANRIGVEFAERFLKGKHAYIVCTHTNRRHIHNHIIFNSTTLDCRGKFNNFWGSSRAVRALSEECSALTEKLKSTEAKMSEVEALKKQVINYLRTRETFRAYKASGYSKRYYAEHEQEILLHRAAKKAFNDLGLKKLPTVKALQAEYAALLAEKRAAYPSYREARAEMKKLLTCRANAEAILCGKKCIANTSSKYGHR